MKKNSSLMYKIGRIINYIIICLGVIGLAYSISMIIFNQIFFDLMKAILPGHVDEKSITLFGIVFTVINSINLIFAIVLAIFATRAIKNLESDDTNTAPHVVMIVLGVFGIQGLFGLFYILGGAFGMAESQMLKQSKTNQAQSE